MAKFKGFILTEKGRELLAKGLAGETITFTKMAIGDGTTATSEREMTALVNQITTLQLLNVDTKGNGTCEINALLTNKSVTTGFYIRELGIFAHGNDNVEILYAYNTSANADYLPPFSANNVVEIEYIDTIIVDQVENITATIDPAVSYITKKYAEDNFLTLKDKMKMLGLEFGGNIQNIGNKIRGKFYYDNVTKFYYECMEDNSLTYNDSRKFRAISNKPLSDKVENLYETHWIDIRNNVPIGKVFETTIKVPTKPYKLLYSVFTGNNRLVDLSRATQYANSEIIVNLGVSQNGFLQYSVAKNTSVIDGRTINVMFVF
jgi:hypothetical protein|nr:MAG TPA: tail collar fiber protein [Caudoviricetes sp.]